MRGTLKFIHSCLPLETVRYWVACATIASGCLCACHSVKYIGVLAARNLAADFHCRCSAMPKGWEHIGTEYMGLLNPSLKAGINVFAVYAACLP